MADYESRMVRGWREDMEDTAAEIRHRLWNAPALTIYYDGETSVSSDQMLGHTRWFNRVFGQERAEAVADLRDLRRRKRKIQRAEFTEEQREKEREWHRLWRARQSDEWHRQQTVKKLLRIAAKPEMYRAIDKRSRDRTKVARNERRRLAYKANPEKDRDRKRAYYAANREQIRTRARAAYIRQKSSKL